MLKGVLCMVLAMLVAQMMIQAPAWAQGGEYTDIYVLGRPASTFSPHQPQDLEDLKDLFDRYEDDLRVVLEKGGWGGNADDIFVALRGAKEGDGTVTRRQIQPGESLKWMAYRKNGEPQVIRNPRWSAKKPFDAWQIKVVSNGAEYTFVVPQSCMNLAYDSSKPMAGPTCNLSATYDKATDKVTVKASSSGDIEITSVGIPGGEGSLSDLQSSGSGTWTFQPAKDGTYNFNAKATKGKQSETCTASVRVERAKPVCDIDVSVDPETNMITVDASGSAGEFALGGFTLADGSAGDMAALQPGADDKWTFDPSATLKRKPGNYTYTFAGSTMLNDFETQCDAAAVIVREAPDHRWIVRGYYAPIYPTTSTVFDEIPAADPAFEGADSNGFIPGQPVFTQFNLESDSGFGANLEYLFAPNWGLQFDALFAEAEAHLMWDQTGGLWLMGEDGLDFSHLNLGANYHFTPDRRVDFYLGAFVGMMSFDDVTVPLPEIDQNFRLEWDDQFTYGIRGGLDVPFKAGSPWLFTAGVDWILVDLEQKNGGNSLNMDPLAGKIGIGYRW
jgi:hypothetical protein